MNRNNSSNNRNNDNNWESWAGAGAITAGVAALAGGIYWLSQGRNANTTTADVPSTRSEPVLRSSDRRSAQRSDDSNSISSYLSNLVNKISWVHEDVVPTSKIPQNPIITNLNSLLADIFLRFIQIRSDDFKLYYKVLDNIFQHLHRKMKEIDLYYNRYSSTVQFAGSHFDNLRIKKPDEFDMDIVIGLPLNINVNTANTQQSDIIIEPKHAGFVQLQMGVQYQKLPMRDGNEWQVNKAAYLWKDDSNYLIQEKFLIWFKSLVIRALNTFQFSGGLPFYYVDGVQYFIRNSESGPAITFIIENRSTGFKLDVDLVPTLKFPENRWPISSSYRPIPSGCEKGMFMVVGKPNKAAHNAIDVKRSWRLALHNQERELMHNSQNLRQALRLVKKLRDTQGMKKIASYYIKTLFFWEIVERNSNLFWSRNNPAILFTIMVGRLHAALVKGEIPYFWNRNNNLIYNIDKATLKRYAMSLVPLMALLEQKENYKHVAKYLLTPEEFREYNARFLHI